MHSFEILKGLTWLMKVDHLGDQLNTQLTDMIVQTNALFKGNEKKFHYLQNDSLPIFPIMIDECLFFSFTSSKRVTNTWYSLSKDKSRLICFTNQREEGFVLKTGLSMFNITSPTKENSVSFMFTESKQAWEKTPKGSFFIWFSLWGLKKCKIIP